MHNQLLTEAIQMIEAVGIKVVGTGQQETSTMILGGTRHYQIFDLQVAVLVPEPLAPKSKKP